MQLRKRHECTLKTQPNAGLKCKSTINVLNSVSGYINVKLYQKTHFEAKQVTCKKEPINCREENKGNFYHHLSVYSYRKESSSR